MIMAKLGPVWMFFLFALVTTFGSLYIKLVVRDTTFCYDDITEKVIVNHLADIEAPK